MGYSIEASGGLIAGVLVRPRPCTNKTLYGATLEAVRVFRKTRRPGMVRVYAGPGHPYAIVEYYGGSIAVVTHYTHRTYTTIDGREGRGGSARRDVVNIYTGGTLSSHTRPMVGGGWVGELA